MTRILFLAAALLFSWPLLAKEKEGGIIGTGVIGQVTGVDVFEVSGMRFGFAPDIELKGIASLEDLRMGMTLSLSTGRDGNAWEVKTLEHTPLLSGPITGPGEVMGVPVAGTLPTTGQVMVDGFWSETGVVATRVTAFTQRTARVSGIYDGRGRVGQVPVRGADLSGFAAGETLTVSGQFESVALTAEEITSGPFMGPEPDLVLLEGFYQPMPNSTALSLQGVAVASAASEATTSLNELVRRCALNGRTDFSRSALTAVEEDIVNSFCVSASN